MLTYDHIKLFSESCLYSEGDFSSAEIKRVIETHPNAAEFKAYFIRELFQNDDLSVNLDSDLLACKLESLDGLGGSIEGYLFLSGQVEPHMASVLSQKMIAGTKDYLVELVEDFSETFHEFLQALCDPETDLKTVFEKRDYAMIKGYLEQIYLAQSAFASQGGHSDLKTDLLTGKNELLSGRFTLDKNKRLKKTTLYLNKLKEIYEKTLSIHHLQALESFLLQYSHPECCEDLPYQHVYRFYQHIGHATHVDGHDDTKLRFIDIDPHHVNLKKRGNDLVIAFDDGGEKVICHDVFNSEFVSQQGKPFAHLTLEFDWLNQKDTCSHLEVIALDSLYRHQENLVSMNRTLHAL